MPISKPLNSAKPRKRPIHEYPGLVALSLGISEALMNTAMGIGTGAAAIVAYGYFSARVQNITNAVDEVGFAIGQTYTKKHGLK